MVCFVSEMCDSKVTERGFDFATLDVNKICLKCIFYSTWLVLRMQKHGATVSLHILHWKNALSWPQMECIEENQSAKCSVGEHLGFLCFKDQRYLWIDFLHHLSRFPQTLMVLWWQWRGGVLTERGTHKVWEVTPWKTFLSASTQFLSHALFQLTGFHQRAFLCWWNNCFFSPQFPISLNHGRFLDLVSVFFQGRSSFCFTILNGKFICIYSVAFSQRQTAFLTQCHSELTWGEKEVLRVQDGLVVLANYSYAFCRATGMKKAGNEWGTVFFIWNKDCLGSLFRPAWTQTLS